MRRRKKLIAALICLLPLSLQAQLTPPSEARLLGLKLTEANKNEVREHIRNLGGFQQDRSTYRHNNIDKYFGYSNLRDSYYVEFRYDANGKIVSAKRLFRRSGLRFNNELRDLQTEEVARELIQDFGQPTFVERKGRMGSPSYSAFTWQDDLVTIRIDRVGGDHFSPIFISYEIDTDPYVAKIPEPEPPPTRRRR